MENPVRKLKKILFILGIAGAVYLGFRYLLPLAVPFLCAYGMALWLRPSVRYFSRKISRRFHGKKKQNSTMLIGAVELLGILLAVIGVGYVGGSFLFSQMKALTEVLPKWLSWLDVKLTGFCRGTARVLGLRDDYLVAIVRGMIRDLGEAVKQASMPAIMNNSMSVLKQGIELIVVLVIFVIATLMFLREMEEIRERKSASMFHREFSIIGRRLVSVGSAWLKSEMVIISVTAALCTIALFLIGNDYALLLGFGIGLVDALPFLGAGVILIPWALVLLIQKQWLKGILFLGLYIVCYFLRQILEARIMGNCMGLTPLETLASMYVGLQLFGISGFLLGPVGLLMIEDLVDLYWKESD